MHEEAGTKEVEGQEASRLSLRSHMKLIPVFWSYDTSEGKLGKRQPESREKTDKMRKKNIIITNASYNQNREDKP